MIVLSGVVEKLKRSLQNEMCSGCGVALKPPALYCPPCTQRFGIRKPEPLCILGESPVYTACQFNLPLKKWLYPYKFEHQTHYKGPLADLWIQYWQSLLEKQPTLIKPPVYVVPIPPRQNNPHHRPHLGPLAKTFAAMFGYPYVPHGLDWQRETEAQHTLAHKRQRWQNMAGSLATGYPAGFKQDEFSPTILLLDDIKTTGATLFEATQAFQRNQRFQETGGKCVGLTLCHLPLAFHK